MTKWAIVRDYTANNAYQELDKEDCVPVYQRGNQFLTFHGDDLFDSFCEASDFIYDAILTTAGRRCALGEFALNDAFPVEVGDSFDWVDAQDILSVEAARIQRQQRPSYRRRAKRVAA